MSSSKKIGSLNETATVSNFVSDSASSSSELSATMRSHSSLFDCGKTIDRRLLISVTSLELVAVGEPASDCAKMLS